jgi:hypothetical protein
MGVKITLEKISKITGRPSVFDICETENGAIVRLEEGGPILARFDTKWAAQQWAADEINNFDFWAVAYYQLMED